MKRAFGAALVASVALSCALVAGSARATVFYDVTYTGLATGQDRGGFFGAVGATYTNTPFTAHYYADSSTPNGLLTINGQSLDLFPVYDAVVPGYDARRTAGRLAPASFAGDYFFGEMGNALVSPSTPTDRNTPYTATGTNDPLSNPGSWNSLYIEGDDRTGVGRFVDIFKFTDESITVGATDPGLGTISAGHTLVPEPAIWAELIFGFAALGSALRGRRRPALPI